MKKIFFLFLFLSCWIQIAFADSLVETVKQQVEYIESDNELFHSMEYVSNRWNSYYFFGDYYYKTISTLQDIKVGYIEPWLVNNYLFSIQWNKIIAIDKTKKTDISPCKTMNTKQLQHIAAYPWTIKVNNYQNSIIWTKIDPNISCFINSSVLYFSNNIKSALDLKYLYSNTEKVESIVKKIPVWDTKSTILKNIYHFVTNTSSYDDDALQTLASQKSNNNWGDYSPFRLESFFEGKKIVCDGYSSTTAFLNTYLGIPSTVVVWNIQPIENTNTAIEWIGHSWVKVWNSFYDPTFDDSNDKNTTYYFQKDKTCFNLDHYMSWRISINTPSERILYIKNNFTHLLSKCPDIMKNTLLKDQSLVDIIKYSLQNYSFAINKNFLCKISDMCSISAKSNSELINILKNITITTYNSDNSIRSVIDLWKELWTLDLSQKTPLLDKNQNTISSEYILTPKDKLVLQQLILSLKQSYSTKYSETQAKEKILQLKLNINTLIKSIKNEKLKSQLIYLYKNI